MGVIIKYEKEIDLFLKDLFYDETWMDDEDYEAVIDETFKTMGTTKQKFSDELEIGIKNGYTIDQQFLLIKKQLK